MASWARVIRNHVMETFERWDEPYGEGTHEGPMPIWAILGNFFFLILCVAAFWWIIPSSVTKFMTLEDAYITYPRVILVFIPCITAFAALSIPAYYRNVRKTLPTHGQMFPLTASIWFMAVVLVTSPIVAVAMGARMKAAGYESCMGPSGSSSMYSSHWVHPPLTCRDVWKMDYDELREVRRAEG